MIVYVTPCIVTWKWSKLSKCLVESQFEFQGLGESTFMSEQPRHCIAAIVPCNDIEASTVFYSRLGLSVYSDHGTYRILSDGKGWILHLSSGSPEGWVVPGRNPSGVYLYLEDVDGLSDQVSDLICGVGPEHKPWGMYEFTVSDPDGTRVRIGWPSRLLLKEQSAGPPSGLCSGPNP